MSSITEDSNNVCQNRTSNVFRSFTTEPKLRRKSSSPSLRKCQEFMKWLWDHPHPPPKLSYETLKWEWIECFGSNEPRFVVRYLGRPATTNRSSWTSRRVNSNTGNVAQFLHADDRPVTAKTGLMQIRGYITFDKQTKMFNIHHELMPYYTEQTCLKLANPQPEVNEESQSSILDMRVCTISDNDEQSLKGKEREKTDLRRLSRYNDARGDSKGGEEEEREVIDDTHTRESPKIMLPSIPDMPKSIHSMPKLTSEEGAILGKQL